MPALFEDVSEARRRLDEERRCKNALNALNPRAVSAALAMLVALEAYAAALTATGWPLPYRLRDELFLYRCLIDYDSSAGSG